MNPTASTFASTPTPLAALDTLQSRFGHQVAARLNDAADQLGGDVTERLRFAREQALERARAMRLTAACATTPAGRSSGGALLLGRLSSGWWFKLASAAPVLALAAGLMLIERWQDSAQIAEAAEIDAALLADDLPPVAYSDAGFVEFLKTPPRE